VTVFRGLTEVGVAVEDLEAASARFAAAFGGTASEVAEMTEAGVEMRYASVAVGDQRINLMQDTGDSGPVARAIKRRGEGLFNVMIEVDDLDAAIERLRAAGVEFVEPEPRVFVDGSYAGRRYDRHRIVWTHPKSLHGLLVEVQEFDWAPDD
jgi:methylmalonyl-CoA/ethylmalonyl-CoA epimerase